MNVFDGLLLNKKEIIDYYYKLLYSVVHRTLTVESYLPKDNNRIRQFELDALHHRAMNPAPYKLYKDTKKYNLKTAEDEDVRVYKEKAVQADYGKNTDRDKLNQYKLEFFVYRVYKKILEYCPIDTGNLRASIRIERNFGANSRYLIYTKCKYASAVHEIFGARHNFPTCAKFMSRAVYEVSAEYDNPYNVYLDIRGEDGLYLYIDDNKEGIIRGRHRLSSTPNKKKLERAELINDVWVRDEIPKELIGFNRFESFYDYEYDLINNDETYDFNPFNDEDEIKPTATNINDIDIGFSSPTYSGTYFGDFDPSDLDFLN